MVSAADASKREGAEPAKDAKDTPPAKPGGDAKPSEDGAKPDDAKPAEAKPDAAAEAKPDGADTKTETKEALATEPPAPPTYDAYTLPENATLDNERVGAFNAILGQFELDSKADHARVQALGQSLVDFYHTEVQRIGEQVMQHQRDVWNRHNETLINELKSDPELGGNRIQTTLGNAKYVLEQFGGSADEQKALLAELDNAGVSNSRRFIALLNRMYERYREPAPVQPNLPAARATNQPGARNWYDRVDGAA